MENLDKVIQSLINKATKEEKEFLLLLFENPALSKYVSNKIQTDFWDNELINNPTSLKIGVAEEEGGKTNNKEFEYALKWVLEQKKVADIQRELYSMLTKDEKAIADEKTKKKILKSSDQIAIKRNN